MKKLYYFTMMLCSLLPIPALAQFAGGDGSQSDPYQVSTPEQLSEVRNYLGSYFIQTNDIDLKGYDHDKDGRGWLPIAGAGTGTLFRGHYNGQNFIITNLYINRPDAPNIGLFGHIGISDDVTDISITNLGLVTVDIKGGRGVGALVGRVTANANTKVEYCFVSYGSVTGDGATGGLVGSNNSYRATANSDGYKPQISKSFANVDVYWSERISGDKFGGLAGCNQKGIVINSYARGSVNVDNTRAQLSSVERVGGLVGCGLQRAEIYYSYSTTLVNVPSSNPTVTNVGGLTGTSDGNTTIVSSFWDIQASGTAVSYGGVGETTADMQNQSTFVSYDFTNIWGIDPDINDGYPYLRTEGEGILPVELTGFYGISRGSGIELNWATASEKNNEFFTLERSQNGIGFIKVSEIKGAGNSNGLLEYSILDEEADPGRNYYRLKQTDFDGSFKYSGIIEVDHTPEDKEISVYPNPAQKSIVIETNTNNPRSYKILDYTGVVLKSGEIEGPSVHLNIEELPSGIYMLSVTDEFQNSKVLKLIKE